jgi:formate dehydrogenase maturation protein FdhE
MGAMGQQPSKAAQKVEEVAAVSCPFCGSTAVEPLSLFGQQLLTVQYYCNGCRTPFEAVKSAASLSEFEGRRSYDI